ncbi:MAG: MBL fold metallo-hydrolase [Geobacteraceae bacterium]|nr:MBL fold metallo-hydrolase [Geobacteraceae bacterium]
MNINNPICIDLDQPGLTGFRQFISSWLYRRDGFNLVVDPGPLSTIPHLITELRRHGVGELDYILLTHIHIDHAGGTGALLQEFPEAKVICHPDGIRHLVSPQKLWEGSRKVLGQMLADAYGEILPVPADSILFAEEIGTAGAKAYLTPGHAQHHCCYLIDDLLFAGEVAGARSVVADGIYIRPATPPRFILEIALSSVERMIALSPARMVFAHYGLVDTAVEHLQIARNQLLLWVEGAAAVAKVAEAEREEAMFAWLLEHDEHFRNFSRLPEDIRARERYFFGNSYRGMAEYVAEKG